VVAATHVKRMPGCLKKPDAEAWLFSAGLSIPLGGLGVFAFPYRPQRGEDRNGDK